MSFMFFITCLVWDLFCLIPDMIKYYKSLRKFQSDEDLRNFLQYFKENEEKVWSALAVAKICCYLHWNARVLIAANASPS